jgi:hypothetical protein
MRTLRLDRGKNEITIHARYALAKPPSEITLTLMSVREPKAPAGATDYGIGRVAFDPRVFGSKAEGIKLEQGRLSAVWGARVWRTLFVASKPPLEADWTVRVTQAQ